MLERTTGCLETGSLRRLLPGSRRPLKSRRMLHFAFWNHGAIELEYSHFWTALIRAPEAIDEHDEKCLRRISNASSGGFLDFLYPSGAVRLIRQYSLLKSDAQEIQRARNGFGRLGQRLYTSVAVEGPPKPAEKDIISSEAKVEDNHTVSATWDQSPDSKRSNSFWESLNGLQVARGDDKAWRQFAIISSNESQSYIPQLLEYVSTSNRSVDLKQATLLFEEIRSTASQEEYGYLIKLHLNVGELQSAMELYREALTKFHIPVGSDILLAHALDKCQWQIACDIWVAFCHFRRAHPSLSYNIWMPSDKISNFYDRATELAGFVRSELDKPLGMRNSLEVSKFATFLVSRALLAMSSEKAIEPCKFNTLLRVLQHWNGDTPERYDRIILRLLDSGHTKLAVQCYRKYRQRTTKKISRPILDKILKIACKNHSILGMQQVLDDWFKFYKRPSGSAYRLCMSAFATQGDVDTVKALFHQYVEYRGRRTALKTADDIAPLLHVHAKRGELPEVLKIFGEIEEKYGLQPTIKCWNILINAYGKVRDVDGAFTQFQRLLNSSLRPDGYTYGTLMGICATRGDLDQALKLYQMAKNQGVARNVVMVDCLVLGHIQDDRLSEAEGICNDALAMDLKVPLARMWNYLLIAYAMRRDLENTNRILHRMYDAGVNYDSATYAALMQALVMVRQPDRAYDILKNVMHEAQMKVTSFHYAIVMGGYIATSELHKVFHVHNQMLRHNKKETVSTRLMTLKASILEDQKSFESRSREEQLANAEQYFYDAYSAPDAQEMIDSMRKGIGSEPLDVAYPSSYFSYLIFVLGQQNAFHRAMQLYDRYVGSVPKHRRNELPLKIINALMAVNLKNMDYDSVQQLWELAFERAKKQGQPIQPPEQPESRKVLPLHRQTLTISLSIQMTSLSHQQKFGLLSRTIKDVQEAGFVLDNKNWNLYIQRLAGSGKYKQAFELCEVKLMDGWTGWARSRWKEPVRNRLPIKLRYLRMNRNPIFLRPVRRTLLYLARAYAAIQDRATEFQSARDLENYLEGRCARTLHAVKTMHRVDDEMEREILERR